MAKYFKMMTYVTGGEDYETHETLLDLNAFRQFQKAIIEHNDFLVLGDRVIKVSSIKEILPADDIVEYYKSVGQKLENMGILSGPVAPELSEPSGDGTLKKLI